MKIDEVRKAAFAVPLTSPAFARGSYRFFDHKYLIITYRTDREALERVVPEPLQIAEPLVKYEFIRMPDSIGFGDYAESGHVIPVTFNGQPGQYTHAMFLNDGPPIYGGRELWGFPKKLAQPTLRPERDALDYEPVRVAAGVMGYKHTPLNFDDVLKALALPNYLLKIIPHVDGSPRILELVDYRLEMSCSRAHGPARPRSNCIRMRRSPICRCAKSSPPHISSYPRRHHAGSRQGRPRLSLGSIAQWISMARSPS
jgi:acetoacetate decarboxylase